MTQYSAQNILKWKPNVIVLININLYLGFQPSSLEFVSHLLFYCPPHTDICSPLWSWFSMETLRLMTKSIFVIVGLPHALVIRCLIMILFLPPNLVFSTSKLWEPRPMGMKLGTSFSATDNSYHLSYQAVGLSFISSHVLLAMSLTEPLRGRGLMVN